MTENKRSRSWCYTLNNYPLIAMSLIRRTPAKYHIMGRETGESGTRHLQGYIEFRNGKTMSAVKKLPGFRRMHLEIRRGTSREAADYCKKDGDFWEEGERSLTQEEKGTEEKDRWSNMVTLGKGGKMDDIADQEPHAFIQHYMTFKRLARDYQIAPLDLEEPPDNLWVYGEPETGKSKYARSLGTCYDKSCNKWWMHYRGDDEYEIVLIDDFSKCHRCLGYYMKRWLDIFSFPSEDKNGGKNIRPKRFVITSNYHPSEIFYEDPVLAEAICRRVRIIHAVRTPEEDTFGYLFK